MRFSYNMATSVGKFQCPLAGRGSVESLTFSLTSAELRVSMPSSGQGVCGVGSFMSSISNREGSFYSPYAPPRFHPEIDTSILSDVISNQQHRFLQACAGLSKGNGL